MRSYQAIVEAKSSFEAALLKAGLKKGVTLTPEQLKAETDPIFWYVWITTVVPSEKETYLTYDVIESPTMVYADGKPKVRRATIEGQLYTRKTNIDVLLLKIEDEILKAEWTFEIKAIDYDPSNKMFIYTFNSSAEVR